MKEGREGAPGWSGAVSKLRDLEGHSAELLPGCKKNKTRTEACTGMMSCGVEFEVGDNVISGNIVTWVGQNAGALLSKICLVFVI